MLRGMLAIALVALTASACSVSRSATAVKSEGLKVKSEVRDSSRVEQVMVAVHDTIVETTTIVVCENEQGDTVQMSVVRDRDRVRDRSQLRDKSEKLIVRVDTVYVAVRDSTDVRNYGATESQSGGTALNRELKWIFWIVVVVIVLIVVIKVKS